MAELTPNVRVRPNGPYVVSVPPLRVRPPIMSERGEPLSWQAEEVSDGGPAYALCRCGHSASKPLCDGSHKEAGFTG